MENVTLFIEEINAKITSLEALKDYREVRRYKRIVSILWENINK